MMEYANQSYSQKIDKVVSVLLPMINKDIPNILSNQERKEAMQTFMVGVSWELNKDKFSRMTSSIKHCASSIYAKFIENEIGCLIKANEVASKSINSIVGRQFNNLWYKGDSRSILYLGQSFAINIDCEESRKVVISEFEKLVSKKAA